MITFGDKKIKEIFQGNKNIVKVYAEINLVFPDEEAYNDQYFTVEVLTPGDFQLGKVSTIDKAVSYSINGEEWTEVHFGSTDSILKNLNAGDKIRFKGTETAYAIDNTAYVAFGIGSTTCTYNVYGNIMSLLYGDNFKNKTAFPTGSTYTFCDLFKGSTALISAENLILPAPVMTGNCYRGLFGKCKSLIKAPVLPATTLATNCYKYMFEECAITEAPELPATAVEDYCYEGMFIKCTFLTIAPDLNISNLNKNYCYQKMFSGCSSLNYIKCLAQSRTSASCTSNWTEGVNAAGTFVSYPGQTVFKETGQESQGAARGNNGIPTGWTVQHITV